METRIEPTIRFGVWIAGDFTTIRQVCREYTLAVGLCVTVTECDFAYTGGLESGVRIGLVNYPRFPTTEAALRDYAIALAELLMTRCCQTSALVVGDKEAI